MSFSYKVKEEIAQSISTKPKADACLYGMLLFCKDFTNSKIILQTENVVVADLFSRLICQAINDENAVNISITQKKNNITLYSLSVEKPSQRKALFDYYKLDSEITTQNIDISKIGKQKNLSSLISGVFLSCGSINDPEKEYHLEFVISTLDLCNELGQILIDFGILAKHTERKHTQVVYLKESENIEDLLTLMGAPKSSLEIMNVKILKNVRNKINRSVNCDNANIEKTLVASEKQVADIELIESKIGLNNIADDLKKIAELRLENPDLSLKELGNALTPSISRSGANHRLTRIAKIADELRLI